MSTSVQSKMMRGAGWMVLFKFVDVRAITNPVVGAHPNAEGHQIMAATMTKAVLEILRP
jgi:lysophospholipase L1-like esterase